MHTIAGMRSSSARLSGAQVPAMVLCYLALCVCLNFLVPWRGLVSGAEVFLAVAIWIVCTRGALPASPLMVMCLSGYVVLLLGNLLVGGSPYLLAKFATYPALLWAMIALGRRLGPGRTRKLASRYLWLFGLAFCANLLISGELGLYETRRLWAFAHVNLAGSYVAGTILPLSVILSAGRSNHVLRRLALVAEAALTRSSGAFLASLVALVNARRLKLNTVAVMTVTVVAVMVAAWQVGAALDAPYYVKLRSAEKLVHSDQLSELWSLAQAREPLKDLGVDGEGSLTWRLYAYAVYAGAIEKESPERLVFGSGAGSYKAVWQGYMPHNDFILILHDFGALGLGATFLALVCLVWRLRKHPVWLAAILVLLLRLAFENNIYSDWLMISWLTWIGLAVGSQRKELGRHG